MKIKTDEQYDLGPDAVIEEKVLAAFLKLPPSRRPTDAATLAFWIGQIVGWPGHDFFAPDTALADHKRNTLALVSEIAQGAAVLDRVNGRDGSAGNLWPLLGDCFPDDEAAAAEAYLRKLGNQLSSLAQASSFVAIKQPRKLGRPSCDRFAMVPIRVVCAYLIHIEGYEPPARNSIKNAGDRSNATLPQGSGVAALYRCGPFPRQNAGSLALTVLDTLGIAISANIDNLVRQVLKERWIIECRDFEFWQLLPDVASPTNDP